jgi:PHD/YefM family antitoxin component YafN of YafNO toxin-antitoxin module
MQVTATQAKNRFGHICAQAKRAPVFIEKGGQVDSVVMSLEQFRALQQGAQSPSSAQRRRVFNAQYRDWITEQDRHFEQHGLWCDSLVAW